MKARNRLGAVIAGAAAIALASAGLAGCASGGGGGGASADQVLRIAIPSPGEGKIEVWQAAKAEFEKQYSGWTVELNFQEDDLYSTIGLQNLLTGGNPPDIYFEWAGDRLATRYKDGYAADITEAVQTSGLAELIVPGAFNNAKVDGKTVMVPYAADVTDVIWYNKKIFADNGIAVPTTIAELDAASAKLKAAGITPFASGNKDLWTVGNWAGQVVSRIAGDQKYADVMQLREPMNNPEFVKGLDVLAKIHSEGWINESVNAIADNEANTLFFKGKAAMLPIGSWLVGIQKDEAPDFEMGWFNWPADAAGAGNQGSVIGVSVGYVINGKSSKVTQAMDFFKILYSPANSEAFVAAGDMPLTKVAQASITDPISKELMSLIENAPAVILPPDTGYDLKVADAFYQAASQVIGGVKSSQEALDEAQGKLDALK